MRDYLAAVFPGLADLPIQQRHRTHALGLGCEESLITFFDVTQPWGCSGCLTRTLIRGR
jgi:hypothetical protein